MLVFKKEYFKLNMLQEFLWLFKRFLKGSRWSYAIGKKFVESGELQKNRLILISKADNLCFLINGYSSSLADVKCRIIKALYLGNCIFLVSIKDSHLEIKYSEMHHFKDVTNSLNVKGYISIQHPRSPGRPNVLTSGTYRGLSGEQWKN